VRARPHGDCEPDEPARCEGRGGDRDDRVAGGGHERGRRRTRAPRRRDDRDACDAGARLARPPRGEAMIPAPFEYELATSVENAIELLGQSEDAKLLAGGHSLLPLMRLRFARPATLVDIGRLSELRY